MTSRPASMHRAESEAYLAERLSELRDCLEHQDFSRRTMRETASRGSMEKCSTIEWLSQSFGLTVFEEDVLLLCAGVEYHGGFSDWCRQQVGMPQPTVALTLARLPVPTWEAFSPEGPLRRHRLVELHQAENAPLVHATLRCDERIAGFLKGSTQMDGRLSAYIQLAGLSTSPGTAPPPSLQAVVDAAVDELLCGVGPPVLLQLLGPDTRSKRSTARTVAERFGKRLFTLDAAALAKNPSDLELVLRLWNREVRLSNSALYIDASSADPEMMRRGAAWMRFLVQVEGLAFIDLDDPLSSGVLGDRPTTSLHVEKPTSAEQLSLWKIGLGATRIDDAARLAGQFRLDAETIMGLAARAQRDSGMDVWNACRRNARPKLDGLAARIDAKADWRDLVLPDPERRMLEAVVSQVASRSRVYDDWGFGEKMNRGLGVSVLFAGESGTGKTMAAEVLARALELDLYRVDLSAVIDKYIGETEKKLRRVFDAADDGGCVLFFDEADALFGKRSEVKDSHDRYANVEINYLLQRMESYRGLAILATNLKNSLDAAFMRRLRFVVNFPLPSARERREMWRRVFPLATPSAGLDFERLASLPLSGGNIHTIALNAAFAAASTTGVVEMEHVLEAARGEFVKLKKPPVGELLRSNFERASP